MILATRGGNRELRMIDSTIAWQLQALSGRVPSGAVSQNEAFGLPAATAAIRVASWAVAKRKLRVWRGDGIYKQPVTTTWQARLFTGTPNVRASWFDVLGQTEASLTARNNAFWLKTKNQAGQVVEVYVLHPDDVEARWNRDGNAPEYRIKAASGGWMQWIDESSVLHFREGFPSPGAVMAPTPFQQHRAAFAGAVGKIRYEATVYDQGLLNKVAVSFPKDVKKEQAEEFRELITDSHGGADRAGGVLVLGGGATAEKIGLSLADAEYVDSKMYSAREVGQILGVPATLLDSNTRDQRPMSPEHEEDRWNRWWLEPRLARIQERVNIDPDFFGPAARAYVCFADSVVKGDVATEAARLVAEVQAGILLPDEARAELGLQPLPDGAGQIPQITPVGGAPNPNTTPATDAPADPEDEESYA